MLVPHAPFLLYILPYGTQTVPVRWVRAPALATREIVTQRDSVASDGLKKNHRSQPAALNSHSRPVFPIARNRPLRIPSLATRLLIFPIARNHTTSDFPITRNQHLLIFPRARNRRDHPETTTTAPKNNSGGISRIVHPNGSPNLAGVPRVPPCSSVCPLEVASPRRAQGSAQAPPN